MTIREIIPPFYPSTDNQQLRWQRHQDLLQLAQQADDLRRELPRELEREVLMLHVRYTPDSAREKVVDRLMDWLEQAVRNYPTGSQSTERSSGTPLLVDRDATQQQEAILLAAELHQVWMTRMVQQRTDSLAGRTVCPFSNPEDAAWLAVAQHVLKREQHPMLVGQQANSGVALIASERRRQIEQEGYTVAHDDQRRNCELRRAAKAYITSVDYRTTGEDRSSMSGRDCDWPFGNDSFKPSTSPIPNLVKAGSLLAAEIDRLERLAK